MYCNFHVIYRVMLNKNTNQKSKMFSRLFNAMTRNVNTSDQKKITASVDLVESYIRCL